MGISVTIPVAQMGAANAALDLLGHGPGNFSVPLRTGAGDATHAGLHAWGDDAFAATLKAMAADFDIAFTEGEGVTFPEHIVARALEWRAEEWTQSPVMKGDRRTSGGKTWESLIDVNVWPPGVSGWREVVAEGYPEWLQPTGAHDAYRAGDRVIFERATWESLRDGNAHSPAVNPAGWLLIEAAPEEPGIPAWTEGTAYRIGDQVTYLGLTYRCIQAHTAFVGAGWNPPAVPNLWSPA